MTARWALELLLWERLQVNLTTRQTPQNVRDTGVRCVEAFLTKGKLGPIEGQLFYLGCQIYLEDLKV